MSVRSTIWRVRIRQKEHSVTAVYRSFTVSHIPFHANAVYGLVVILHASLFLGRTVVIQPAFNPESFVNDIHKYSFQLVRLTPDTKLPLSS
jgi:acyl-CoA synthetase (AMP-forming)/AMP-acid ligase II